MSEWPLQLASAGAASLALASLWLLWRLWPPFLQRLMGAVRHGGRRGADSRVAAGLGAAGRIALQLLLTLAALYEPLAQRLPVRLKLGISRDLERAGLATLFTATLFMAVPVALATLALPLAGFAALAVGMPFTHVALLALVFAVGAPLLRLRRLAQRRQVQVQRDLPGYLEMITLGLEAGAAFPTALQLAMARAPAGALREEFGRVLQELRAGHARRDALVRLDQRLGLPSLSATVAAIVQAEATGVSMAPVLRAQAQRGTQERFARAEKLAMEAPVKMLGPLILCIFPCTFIVVGFPIAAMLLWGA